MPLLPRWRGVHAVMPLLSRGRWIRGVMPLPLSARGRGILLAFAAPVLRAGSAAVPPFGAYSAPALCLQPCTLLHRR